jgi:hypothetical protein
MRFFAFGTLFACGLLLLGMAMLALERLAAVRRAPQRSPSHRVAGAQRMSGFAR